MEDLISACRKHVVVSTGSSPFKVGDNQRPERTMSGVENLRLSLPFPAKTFREKEILPTSSGGEGENDIRKDVRPRDDSS